MDSAVRMAGDATGLKSLARAHPFLSENERMDGENSTEPVEFLGLRGRFYLSAERLYQLDEAGNPRLVRLVGTAACRMLRKLLEHKGTLVSTEILISAGWEYSEKKILEHATVRRRQSLFEHGDDVTCVFLVLAGEVELFAENGHGRTVIARKKTFELFGELEEIDNG
jgi:hypothetical protein